MGVLLLFTHFVLTRIHFDKKIRYLTPKNSLVLGAALETSHGVRFHRVLSLVAPSLPSRA